MTVIFFSQDRPMELDAALRSWKRHCRDGADGMVKVLFAASTPRLHSCYRQLIREHPSVDFVPEKDFRRDVRVLCSQNKFAGLATDQCIVIRNFSLAETAAALERHPEAAGFSLLGPEGAAVDHTIDSGGGSSKFAAVENGFFKFRWSEESGAVPPPANWNGVIYRASDILAFLNNIPSDDEDSVAARWRTGAFRLAPDSPPMLCSAAPLAVVMATTDGAAEFARGKRLDLTAWENPPPAGRSPLGDGQMLETGPALPLVSVIIPCYNQAQYLAEAVESVVAQTLADWEIIIVDDGSPDVTAAVAEQLIAGHSSRRIRLLRQRNGGLARARNAGIAAAAGAFILPLDADDKIAPSFLEKTVALLDRHPELAIAYTDVEHFGAAQKTLAAAEFDPEKILHGNQLNYCSLFRREAWAQTGGYNANMIWGYEDWDFWISCAEHGLRAGRIPEALLLYRVKQSSMFTAATARDAELRARLRLNHPSCYEEKQRVEARDIWSAMTVPVSPDAPKVSVIVPTYNRPDRLAEALRSINSQTYQDAEIIVINDDGLDVAAVIERCRAGLEIVYLRHDKNRGLAAARNTGLRRARGKYIAYLDDDDIFLPGHLQTLVEWLESSGQRAAYTDASCAEEELVNGSYAVVRREVRYSNDWDNDEILVKNLVPVLCFLHERTAGIAAGEFDEKLTTHEDWDYWIRLSRVCTPVHIKKVTCEFRARTDGSSMTSSRRADFLRTARIIYRKYQEYVDGREGIRQLQKKFLRGLEEETGAARSGFAALLRRIFGRQAH